MDRSITGMAAEHKLYANRSVVDFQKSLLAWYAEARRQFPWRSKPAPYGVLIAEKLLQQTAAREVVIRAYNQFLHIYPTPERLATAEADQVVAIVTPLGLTYRARELRSLGQVLVDRHHGKVPDRLEELMALPGIGEYSARAVLSFAFERDIAVVDTKVARLLYRLYGLPGPLPANPARKKALQEMAQALVPVGRAREYNWAVLDLCSLVCTSRKPKCSACPVRSFCDYGSSATAAPSRPKS
jgi:A/G-specific adenine glycosylase